MTLTTRIQAKPEPSIEGNPFDVVQPLSSGLFYVIVLADGIPVGQMAGFVRGTRWWADSYFVAEGFRNGAITQHLRQCFFDAMAERTAEFYAVIKDCVAPPEQVLGGRSFVGRYAGLRVEMLTRLRGAGRYRYDLSSLRTTAATG